MSVQRMHKNLTRIIPWTSFCGKICVTSHVKLHSLLFELIGYIMNFFFGVNNCRLEVIFIQQSRVVIRKCDRCVIWTEGVFNWKTLALHHAPPRRIQGQALLKKVEILFSLRHRFLHSGTYLSITFFSHAVRISSQRLVVCHCSQFAKLPNKK